MKNNKIDYDDAKILFFLPIVKNQSVLDLGVVQHQPEKSGKDTWLHRAIRSVSREVVGVDIDKKGVEYLNHNGYNVVHGDAQRLNLNRTFEVIVAGDIIEHLTNLDGFLDSVKLHMNENSIFAVSTPNPFWWRTWVTVALKGDANPHSQHTCWFCEKTLTQLLDRKGFVVKQVNYGTVYDLSTFTQRFTKILNYILPFPVRFKHNTIMIIAAKK